MLALIAPFIELPSFLMNNWKLLVAILGAVVIAVFVWSWDHRGTQVAALAAQNVTLQGDIVVLEKQADIMRDAMKQAAARSAQSQKETSQFNSISEEAARAPTSDDAPIAPVLRHGLDSLDKLLNAASDSR